MRETVRVWPTEKEYLAVWEDKANKAAPDAYYNAQASLDCVNRHTVGTTEDITEICNVIARLKANPEDKKRYDAIMAEGATKMQTKLSKERATIAVTAFLYWLGGSVAAYIAGWIVAWVIRGFKQPKETG